MCFPSCVIPLDELADIAPEPVVPCNIAPKLSVWEREREREREWFIGKELVPPKGAQKLGNVARLLAGYDTQEI